MKVQVEILCIGEDPVPGGVPIYCLYLKKAISVKVKTIYDREKQLSVFILWMAPYGKL